MSNYNSIVILAKNIRMDREYRNVTNLSNDTIRRICNDKNHQVQTANNFSYIRTTPNQIDVPFTYDDCISANYIAFQNPLYSNKWFFGWIDDVQMLSNNARRIYFTIDAWTTFFNDVNITSSFVIREHVNDDTVGKHTVPENLETGEYIVSNVVQVNEMDELAVVLQVTQNVTGEEILSTNYGGIWSAGGAYICNTIRELDNIIKSYGKGKNEAIIQAYIVPKCFIDNKNTSLEYSGQDSPVYITKKIVKPTTLDGYKPRNNKLLTFPYCFLNLSNNNGTTNTYHYELFNSNDVLFNIKGVPSVGGSIKATPYNYKNKLEYDNEEEGVIAGKYPTLSWSEDAYTNWLTQNSVNLSLGLSSSIISIAGGLASGNPVAGIGGLISGATSITEQIGTVYQHSLVPYTAKGNTNGGDINVSSSSNSFIFYPTTIRKEYAIIIDNYFSRFGYKVNVVKKPNITGRKNWNYIKISDGDVLGYASIPQIYMDTINQIARRGTTIWHSHDDIGNYSLDNSII